MVEATEAQADDQDHRKLETQRDVRHAAARIERREPAARPFDHDPGCEALQPREMRGDVLDVDRNAHGRGGEMRRHRRCERIWIHVGVIRRDRRCREQRLGVGAAQPLRGLVTAARDGLHPHRRLARRAQVRKQRAGDEGLAHVGAGAGDEPTAHKGTRDEIRGAREKGVVPALARLTFQPSFMPWAGEEILLATDTAFQPSPLVPRPSPLFKGAQAWPYTTSYVAGMRPSMASAS